MTSEAVVLVHGTRTSSSQWDRQVPSLLAAGYTVVVPDLPGHGARRVEPFTLDAAISTITDAIATAATLTGQDLGAQDEDGSLSAGDHRRVHLVGSSLGGMLAIHAAAARHPALASLIVCGGAVQPTPLTARLYGRLVELADRLPGGTDGSSRLFTLLLCPDGARAYLRGGRAGTVVVAPAFRAIASLDLRADVARIAVPVTFLHGRFDQLRLQEKSFVSSARDGHLEVLPYGTHLVNLNRPERFTADLLRVLARASSPPTLGL